MASCPKCGRHLKITDLKPDCPGCGVNLLYYQMEDRLEQDALKAQKETEAAARFVKGMKAATIGSLWPVLRIVVYLLTVGALFLPVFAGKEGDLAGNAGGVGLLQFLAAVMAEGADKMQVLFGSLPAVLCTVFFFGGALFTLVSLLLSLFSFTKRGMGRNLVLWVLTALVLLVPGGVLAVSGTAVLQPGYFAVAGLLIITLVLHGVINKKNLHTAA